MERYLIMSDLDGTLLNKKSKLTFKTKRYIKKITKQGHLFIISTGRPFQGCIKYYKELKLTTPLVCDNGGSIHFPNNHSLDIYAYIPLDIFLEFIQEIKEYIFAAYSSDLEAIHFYNRKDVPSFLQHLEPPYREIFEGDFLDIIKKSPINPSIFTLRENIHKVIEIAKQEKYSKHFSFRTWISDYKISTIELYALDGSKGDALNKLKQYFNIKKENDLTFGDQQNDLTLISYAHNGVAMINGKDELKKVAKYITTKPNYKNGEIHFIKQFFKSKKGNS